MPYRFAVALTLIALAFPAAAEEPAPPAKDKPVTAQQQKMKECNAEAKTKSLKGDERRKFMSTCLSKS